MIINHSSFDILKISTKVNTFNYIYTFDGYSCSSKRSSLLLYNCIKSYIFDLYYICFDMYWYKRIEDVNES